MNDVQQRPVGSYRWIICALLFFATTINYLDRQVLGLLAPTLQRDLGWSEADYGNIVSWFSFMYGLTMLGMGRVMDWLGTRRGFALAIIAWSTAAMAHAAARSVVAFSFARAFLGLGESGNFPGAIKTVSEWFPNSERALAVGIFNAGSNVGAVLAPITVPYIALTWGWEWAFIATGATGFIWLVFWWALYREPAKHPKVSPAELALIEGDRAVAAPRIPWFQLLRYRQTWAFLIGKSLTDPVWLFYLFWLPKFLDAGWGVKLAGVAAPLVAIYVFADTGSVIGGWFSSALIKRGWTVNRARKTAMLVAALLIVPTLFAPRVNGMWAAVALVSVAAAAHQWWSANLFTSVSDMFPRTAVGSVTGIGGFGGAMAGFFFQRYTGSILQATGGKYGIIFAICGVAYVGAWILFHLLVPRMKPAGVATANR
jgi:ACS family hexuronate transporter-like MFS transporter